MAPPGSFAVKRPPMATLFLHLLLVVCTIVASCGEARMSDGSFVSKNPRSFEIQMGVASLRRQLATTNATAMNATTSLAEDAEVLFLFKAAITADPLNVTRYWKPIGRRQLVNPCKPWVGITCTKRRVTAINLYNQSLSGPLPLELGRLSQLTALNLSTNSFAGPIPAELSPDLQTLDLGSNNFNGSLPSSLGSLLNLTSLVLSANALTGAIPTNITNLTNLQTLNLSRNGFSGPIPGDLSIGLEVLDLSNNNLNGTIPDLDRLVNLTVLNVRNNSFQGGLPLTLGNCTGLSTLDASENPSLGGPIPATLGNLTRLRSLHIADSNLSRTIPQELNALSVLTEIDLSSNSLSGEIPFQNLSNLTVLHLQSNRLEGDFISRVPSFPSLGSLDVRNNALTGSIPNAIGAVQFKTGLLLGSNQMNGSIPDGLGQLTLVKRIDLSANRFSGSVPDSIQTCLSLAELNVSYNNLNGSLPTLSNLAFLQLFDGSFNSFSGEVSTAFVDFASLQFLNVSSNLLSGEVPTFATHDNVNTRSFLNNSALCGPLLEISCGFSGKLATSKIVYIAIGSAAGFVALLVLFFVLFRCRKGWNLKGSKHSSQVSAELQLKVTSDEILAATDQFRETGYIGGGTLSTVYRGVLPDETVVAVKRLAITTPESESEVAVKALEAELEVLGHIRHKSLVKVLGYCCSPETKALVVEYMPHGSLDSLLYPREDEEVHRAFDWTVRFKIAVEVVEGLKYLHVESQHPVVHGDVKPSNILFDAKMEARIADFGVARILHEYGFRPASSPSTPDSAAAHLQYTSPDVAESGIPSMKGDVYSFGIVLLEMVTSRSLDSLKPGQTLPEWVRATVSNCKALRDVLDPRLLPDLAMHQQKMAMVLGVALLCTRNQPQERPNMDDVYKMLVHIRSKSSNSSRRRGLMSSGRRRSSTSSSASEVQPVPFQQPLPHTPSLSDWTPSGNL